MLSGSSKSPSYPIRGDSLAEQIYRQLTRAILSGSFAPEERVNIRQNADEMGVSVTPVREAIQRLVSEGVLHLTDKNTIIVPNRTEPEIQEIFDIRRVLEGDMAATAAPLLTDDDAAFLARTHEIYLDALDMENFKEALRLNAQFHFHIYQRADLPVRLKFAEGLWLRIGPSLRHMYPTLQRDRTDHRRHEAIIESAARRDPAALRAAIVADLDSSQHALNNYVRDYARDARPDRVRRRAR